MRMPFRSLRLRLQILALAALLGGAAQTYGAEPQHALVIVEQPGCHYCIRWHDEIGPAYPKTALGAFAPLRSAQLRDPPGDLTYARRVMFTPTFILVDAQGAELARLEGYPGEDFFWPMIERLVADTAGFDPDAPREN